MTHSLINPKSGWRCCIKAFLMTAFLIQAFAVPSVVHGDMRISLDEPEYKLLTAEPEIVLEAPSDEPSRSPFRITLFDPEEGESGSRLWSQTKLMAGLGVGVAGFIALLP